MKRNLSMPVSDSLMRRLVSKELETAGTTLLDGVKDTSKAAEMKKAAVDEAMKKVDATSWPDRDNATLRGWLERTFDQMLATRRQQFEAAKLAAAARRAAGEKPADAAKSIIDRMEQKQSGTEFVLPDKVQNAVRKRVADDLRKAPDFGRKDSWAQNLVADLRFFGVDEKQARYIADLTWREHELKAANANIRAQEHAVEHGALAPIVDAILATPLSQQNGDWIAKTAHDYLTKAGLSDDQATNAAKVFQVQLEKRIAEAQAKAFEKAANAYAPFARPIRRRRFPTRSRRPMAGAGSRRPTSSVSGRSIRNSRIPRRPATSGRNSPMKPARLSPRRRRLRACSKS